MPPTTFAVTCDTFEKLARLPYSHVHHLSTSFLDPVALRALADAAYNWAPVDAVGDIDTSDALQSRLPALAPSIESIGASLAAAMGAAVASAGGRARIAGVPGNIAFLTCLGASFHNDVFSDWPASLFWVLALDVVDVEFVMPQLGVRQRLTPGDLVIFDPSLAHGLCRPRDGGRFSYESFDQDSPDSAQAFLSGEWRLNRAQWAALGCAWQSEDAPVFRGATDLLTADFDPNTGALLTATTVGKSADLPGHATLMQTV